MITSNKAALLKKKFRIMKTNLTIHNWNNKMLHIQERHQYHRIINLRVPQPAISDFMTKPISSKVTYDGKNKENIT